MTVLRAVILAACAVIAASAQAAPNDGVPARLDRYLTEATARRDFNGTVLVARDGKILLEKGYGFADVARRTPNGPATRFRISSLTQTFTRVALLQLVAAHRLSLDRSVCAYVRPCPAAWRPLTLRLLLDHRSGLPIVLPHLGTRTLAAWIDRLRAQPLRASPGRVRDRGDGPQLLAAYIVERVSGRSWQDYVTARIVRPLGMASTELDRPDAPGRATPYFRAKGRRLEAPASFPPLSSPDVAYGLLSTVGDMFRLDRALHDGTLPAGESEATHFELGHGPTALPTAGTRPTSMTTRASRSSPSATWAATRSPKSWTGSA